jgi:NAD-dependent deacetylase
MDSCQAAADRIRGARRVIAFTGAGVSVESGIPSFRGKTGLWSRYDPECLNIDRFLRSPEQTWPVIRDIFYDYFGQARPNDAHRILSEWERDGLIAGIITQNIDNLHFDAGSRVVHEFHGNSRTLVCLRCGARRLAADTDLHAIPPLCPICGGLLKPDFVFFGEAIPEPARTQAFDEAELADLFLLIGTTGEVGPANLIPRIAKRNGAYIVEINPEPSLYTGSITDIHLAGGAAEIMRKLDELVR